MPKNKKNKDDSSDEEVEQNNDTSVFQQAPTSRPKKFPKVRKPRIRNRILSPKQVHKLAEMESHQIARNHNFKELEFIVKSLTTIYEQLRAPKPQEKDGVSQKSSQNSTKKPSKSRVRSLARGRKKSLRKRGKIFSMSRRPSVGPNLTAKIKKGLQDRKKKAKDDELNEEKLAKYKMFEVEKALEKTDIAFRTHKNFKEKEKARWRAWEQTQREKSTESLINMKSLLPKNLKVMTEEQVAKQLEGNIFLARRFVRHQVFQLFNMNLDRIQRIHPADFSNKYHYGSLDIKELRALYAHTKGLKRAWRTGLKKKLFEMTEKEQNKTLKPRDIEHPAYRGEPEHNHDRKPQIIKLLDSRPVYDADDFVLGKSTQRRASRAGTLVARELQEVLSTDGDDAPAPSQIRRRQSMIEERRRKEEAEERRRPSEIEAFYLQPRAPDEPVDYSSLSRTSRRKSNSMSLKGREMTSDGEKKHRRPKNNIFAVEERDKEGGTLADDEDSDPDDLFIPKQKKKKKERRASNLEEYFADRGDQKPKKPERRRSKFDWDEKDYSVTPADDEKAIRRKQSELFQKAFEMINSDEVKEDDEVFMKTIRKLSVFSSTISESDWEDQMSNLDFDDDDDDDDVVPQKPVERTNTSSSNSSEELDESAELETLSRSWLE